MAGPLYVRMFCEHEDGVEGRNLYVVANIKSY